MWLWERQKIQKLLQNSQQFYVFPSKHAFFFVSSHLNKTTTYEDPRRWGSTAAAGSDPEEIPEPRTVALVRDQELGFGFVAGSEKPVIVR